MSAYDWHPQQQQQRQQQQQQQQQQFVVDETHLHEVKGTGKRSRQTYSKYQTAVLETVFQTSRYIVRNKRQQMSAELSLTERQIKIWFQNRRMKEKKCHKEAPRIVVDRHVQQPRVQGECCPPAALAAGYAEDYCNNAVEPADDPRDDDVFAGGYHPAVTKHRPDDGGGYAVYGGYDLLTATTDPYDQRLAKQQCWSAPVDFHQDLYGDLDSSHFQRLSTNHHHYPLNSQVQDYCPPQLQAAHGY